MWILIKSPAGEHFLELHSDIAISGDSAYYFMCMPELEWDLQRIRAYCRERSFILEENVAPPDRLLPTEAKDKVQELTDIAVMAIKNIKGDQEETWIPNREQLQAVMEIIAPYVEIKAD